MIGISNIKIKSITQSPLSWVSDFQRFNEDLHLTETERFESDELYAHFEKERELRLNNPDVFWTKSITFKNKQLDAIKKGIYQTFFGEVLPKGPRILIACEESGVVRSAFNRAGYSAVSVDVMPTRHSGPHRVMDIELFLKMFTEWDLIIAHPPCTYLANSGVKHLANEVPNGKRWHDLKEAIRFFKIFTEWSDPDTAIAVENPVMHKYGRVGFELNGEWVEGVGDKSGRVVQPYHHGHLEQKSTCFWLRNLVPLQPTNNVQKEMMKLPINERQKVHYMPPSPNRARDRATTYKGIAEAMVNQWGPIAKEIYERRTAV